MEQDPPLRSQTDFTNKHHSQAMGRDHAANGIETPHIKQTIRAAPLATPFRLRFTKLNHCFKTSWIFIHPKCSVSNGTFRVSNNS